MASLTSTAGLRAGGRLTRAAADPISGVSRVTPAALSWPALCANWKENHIMPGNRISSHPMPEPQILLTGLAFGESPRWHAGRLWLANWGTPDLVTAGLDGAGESAARVPPSIPCSIDWLPDGRLLVVSGRTARVLHAKDDGPLAVHADLSGLGSVFNEIVVDGRGDAYVNGGPPPAAARQRARPRPHPAER